MTERAAYDELCAYTLTHGSATFIHQHVVDAFAAQTAADGTKPITLTFALVGLYLHVERRFSGREVQQAHQRLARRKPAWPSFVLPRDRGSVTAADVLARAAGTERDNAIMRGPSRCGALPAKPPRVEELLSDYPEAFYAVAERPKQAMQLTASNPDVYTRCLTSCVYNACMHRGLAAAGLVSRSASTAL
jgi:hypothetical protein